jgi:hypothetical protein
MVTEPKKKKKTRYKLKLREREREKTVRERETVRERIRDREKERKPEPLRLEQLDSNLEGGGGDCSVEAVEPWFFKQRKGRTAWRRASREGQKFPGRVGSRNPGILITLTEFGPGPVEIKQITNFFNLYLLFKP